MHARDIVMQAHKAVRNPPGIIPKHMFGRDIGKAYDPSADPIEQHAHPSVPFRAPCQLASLLNSIHGSTRKLQCFYRVS